LTPDYYTWSGPERGVYYSVTDWGLFNDDGITVTQLRHMFYESADEWGTNDTFVFKVYDADLATVLYTSPILTASNYPTWTTFTLPSPMTFTTEFAVTVRPTTTDTLYYPSSLFSSESYGNSIVTSDDPLYDWALLDGEFLQGIYVSGSEWASSSAYSGMIGPGASQDLTIHFDATGIAAGITKTANMVFLNNSNHVNPRGDNWIIPLTLNVISGGISTPTGVAIALDGINPKLTWTPVGGAGSYRVYGSDNAYASDWGAAIASPTTTSYTITSGPLYHFYKITAVSGAKNITETAVGKPVSTRKIMKNRK
jgi:hypothetical protein